MSNKSYLTPNSGTIFGDPGKVPIPVVGPLVSIIIPCCGMLEYTKLLLPSILQHTRPPFEPGGGNRPNTLSADHPSSERSNRCNRQPLANGARAKCRPSL